MHRQIVAASRAWVLTGVLIVAGSIWVVAQAAALQGQGGAGGTAPSNFASNFTGKITVENSSEMRMSRIRFEAGARTNWHVHSTGQLLLIESGRGRLFEQGGRIIELKAGEPVYTRANVPHWHGAAPDSPAVQFSVYSGTLD